VVHPGRALLTDIGNEHRVRDQTMPPNPALCQRAIQSRTKVRAGPDLRASSGRTPVSSVEPGALNSGAFADRELDRGGGCLLVDRFRYRARLGRRRWVALATIAA